MNSQIILVIFFISGAILFVLARMVKSIRKLAKPGSAQKNDGGCPKCRN